MIYSHKKHDLIEKINNFYPGRASNGSIMDLFLTFLEMGQVTMKSLVKERKENYEYLKAQLTESMKPYGERCLETKNNKISIATTLTTLHAKVFEPHSISPTFFGSYLFSRRVSGVRVVYTSTSKINDQHFTNYGSHSHAYPHLPYFTAAASIGQTKADIDLFIIRIREAFEHFMKQEPKKLIEMEKIMAGLNIEEESKKKVDEEEKKKE